DAAFLVPFVFAVELHPIPFLQRIDSWREIDIVRDQERMPRGQLEDEALVTAILVVIAQRSQHRAGTSNLNIAPVSIEQRLDVVLSRTLERRLPLYSDGVDGSGPFEIPECARDERDQQRPDFPHREATAWAFLSTRRQLRIRREIFV